MTWKMPITTRSLSHSESVVVTWTAATSNWSTG